MLLRLLLCRILLFIAAFHVAFDSGLVGLLAVLVCVCVKELPVLIIVTLKLFHELRLCDRFDVVLQSYVIRLSCFGVDHLLQHLVEPAQLTLAILVDEGVR